MGKDKEKVYYEGRVELDEAVSHLEHLVEGLRQGTVGFSKGEYRVTLRPEAMIRIDVEARRDGEKESVEIELSWKKPPEDEGGRLEISDRDVEPEGEPEAEDSPETDEPAPPYARAGEAADDGEGGEQES